MSKDRLSRALSNLAGLVSRLRGPNGCPWDAMQTDSTVKMYLLEEAYEVLDAIETGSPEDVCQELGDLLFQVIFLTSLAEERGEFDLEEVLEKITEKMINRHPHVFGEASVGSPEEVSENWEKIKNAEKGDPKVSSSLLQEVPVNLPALLSAHRLSYRASKVGFDWEGREEIWGKVKEEFEELNKTILNSDEEGIEEELGDLLFSLVNLARHWGLNAERLLRRANQKFIKRFREMEEELKSTGTELDKATPDEMNRAWEKIKVNTG
ncbi:MAG: nucleoside triphosphate pyrophosphohydrolase [Deltaproteobacteria bacterium]|nr:nucleoside triphosphate pyrophosphohydrolase [Deltaproteobacteria bacterium]